MKLEALSRQGKRNDLTSDQVGPKLTAAEKVAAGVSDTQTQVKRYIRLNNLVPDLQKKVDDGSLKFNPAVELSYLSPTEQNDFLDYIESQSCSPSLSQAQRMKKLSQAGKLNDDTMLDIMMEQKKPEKCELTFSGDVLRKYFPRSYTPQRMQETIIKLLEAWVKKRQRDQER